MNRLIFMIVFLFAYEAMANDDFNHSYSKFKLKDIVIESGYLKNTGSDGYIVLDQINLNRYQLCGLELDIEFLDPMSKPGIFEIFWRTNKTDFGERNKAFVIINQDTSKTRSTYLVPLCKLYHFSGNLNNKLGQSIIKGLRIDFPSNKRIAIKIHSIHFRDANSTSSMLKQESSNMIILEPYERVKATSFTSIDVVLPKLFFAVQEGLKHLIADIGFFIFWICLIVTLKILIGLSWYKQYHGK